MLCLVLVAYWGVAIAEDPYLSQSNISQSKEESTLTSTIDPWSPIVGDTEGVPGVTARVESVHGRRAAISLMENIRRQLMHDNYDYISDDSEEPSMIKKPLPSQDNSKRSTLARKTAMTRTGSPRASQTSPAVAPITSAVVSHRETRLLPHLSAKPILSAIQVARVNMPSKSNKNQDFRSFSDSPILRSLDKDSHRYATKMAKDIKSEIDVSKKDLLFYVDDIHLRRNDPHSAVSSIVGRRAYESADMINKITINGSKQNRLNSQNTMLRNSVKEKHSNVRKSNNYDFNQNNQRNNQLGIKTQSHLDDEYEAVEAERNSKANLPSNHDRRHDNIQNNKDIEQTESKNDGDHKQREVQFDKREKQLPNSLYKNRHNEKDHNYTQDDKRNMPSISEHSHQDVEEIKNQPVNMQINVTFGSISDYHETTQEPQRLNVKNEIKNINQANREQKVYDEEQKVAIDSRLQFRRSNRRRKHRRKHDRNHKYIEQLDRTQYGDSTDDKDTQDSLKQAVQPQINRNSQSSHKRNDYNKNKPNKRLPHESRREKKNQLKSEHSEQSNEQSHNVHKTHESDQKKGTNIGKRIRHQPEESVLQKSNESEKQSDDDNSLYTQNVNDDKTTDKVLVKKSTLRSTKTDHRRPIPKNVVNKKMNVDNKQTASDNQNDNNFSNNLHGDTTHDGLKGDQNDDKNQQYKDQTSQYLDSMDNEDFDKFDGRRMNTPRNDTKLAQERNGQNGECNNSQHGCFGKEYKKHDKQSVTANGQELTSPTAKYKLLKVRAAGGSRRSNTGERQFLQERGPKGVALFALDGAPFPQFRLPRSRRQYMDDHADKRPPLIEQMSRRSLNRKHSRHRSRKHQD